jgi:hypothetical protein
MSKHINVNPDHYKLAGRDKLGKTQPINAKAKSTEQEDRERWAKEQELRKKPEDEA